MSTKTRTTMVRYSRIVPVVSIMYLIAYLDRNNIGFGFGGMEKSLHFSATLSGLAGGIFFLGYLIFQIPGGHIASKFSAKKVMFFTMVMWGVFAVGTGFVTNATQLLLLRFLLGVAEGAVLPASLVMIAKWFPLSERARANSFWAIASPVSGIIMGPLSGLILSALSWQWLFIIEGLPAILWAFVALFVAEDSPQKAKFVSNDEKQYLEQEFAKDAAIPPVASNWREAFLDRKVWLMAIVGFLINTGFYGYSLWLPTVIKSLTNTGVIAVGLLSALPNVAAVIGQYLNGRHSDRTGERKFHVALPLIGGGICLLLSVLTFGSPIASMTFLIITLGVMWSFQGPFWAVPALLVSESGLGATMGLINGVASIGGFLGPFVVGYLINQTHSPTAGLVFLVVVLILAGLVMLTLRFKDRASNIQSTSGIVR